MFSANDDVEFRMTVATQSAGTATNVVLTDVLPIGFVISTAANAVTVDGTNTTVSVNANNTFTLNLGTMTHQSTKTIIVRGKMTNASNTTGNYYKNTASLTYATPGNPNNTAGPVIVYQTPLIQVVPQLTIDKQQRLVGTSAWSGVGLNTFSNIVYTSPAEFEFRIIITNNG